MLKIKHLSVEVSGNPILKDIHLHVREGETLVLFGPNGCGKTTLIKTIMGFSGYEITAGEIIFKGQVINHLSVEDRVRLGIGMMYQNPPKIRGVRLGQIARFLRDDKNYVQSLAGRLSLAEHQDREVNVQFSGGETKRSELFQLALQDPDFFLLDEPESGVDLVNISVMGEVLGDCLSRRGKSGLIITHTGYILDYVEARKGCVLMSGSLWCVGDARIIFQNIRKSGYDKCHACDRHRKINA